MRCGNCTAGHDSVAEVKECYATIGRLHSEPATQKQLAFLNMMRAERGEELYPEDCIRDRDASDAFWLSKSAASAQISILAKDGQGPQTSVVRDDLHQNFQSAPAGYYATPNEDGGNDLDFWRIERPTQGRWANRVFVSRILGGHDPIRLTRGIQTEALRMISKTGIKEAAQLYGQNLGRCSRCNRTLTDELSRQLGIGPDCRAKGEAA